VGFETGLYLSEIMQPFILRPAPYTSAYTSRLDADLTPRYKRLMTTPPRRFPPQWHVEDAGDGEADLRGAFYLTCMVGLPQVMSAREGESRLDILI
jgi:hypothetical protein